MGNNPVMYIDPDGNSIFPSTDALRSAAHSVMNSAKHLTFPFTKQQQKILAMLNCSV
jgi:hypothetical protein